MGRTHDADAVVAKVLGRFQDKGSEQVGRSRATLVLEPGLAPLGPALTDGNFMVVAANDIGSFEERRELVAGRILITRNAAAFIDEAPVLGIGIIGLDAMGTDIYVGPTLAESATARMISRVFIDFDLGVESGAYLLLLHPKQRHAFRCLS